MIQCIIPLTKLLEFVYNFKQIIVSNLDAIIRELNLSLRPMIEKRWM